MSNLSQFRGQAVGPVGSSILVENGASFAPADVLTYGANQYIRSGVLAAYSSAYSQAVIDCPQLRVTGTMRTGQNIASAEADRSFRQQIGGVPTLVPTGASTVYTSADRITWTSAGAMTGSPPTATATSVSVVWNGTRGVGVNASTGTTMSYSPSGTLVGAWTNVATAAGGTIVFMCHDGTRFISMPSQAVASSSPVAYLTSLDGVTWTSRPGVTLAGFDTGISQVFGNGGVAYVIGSTGKIARSTDAIAWTLKGTLTSTVNKLYASAVIGSKVILVYRSSTTLYIDVSTDDGATWSNKLTLTVGTNYVAGAYIDPTTGNGYVLFTNGVSTGPSIIYKSSDGGLTWPIDQQVLLAGSSVIASVMTAYVDQVGWALVRSVATSGYAMEGQWDRTDWVGSQNAAYLYAPATGNFPRLYSYVRTM